MPLICTRMPFRLAALQAGLELQPDTSPPVLERIPGWRRRPFSATGADADSRFDVIRGYLRFYGPATPAHGSRPFLDAPVRDVKAHWPVDAEEIEVNGEKRWILEQDREDLFGLPPPIRVRRLPRAFRSVCTAQGSGDPGSPIRPPRRRCGRPSGDRARWWSVARSTGLWRPRASGKKLKVAITPWGTWSRSARRSSGPAGRNTCRISRRRALRNWSKYLDRASGIRIIPAHTRPDSEKETPNDNLNATFARTLVQER